MGGESISHHPPKISKTKESTPPNNLPWLVQNFPIHHPRNTMDKQPRSAIIARTNNEQTIDHHTRILRYLDVIDPPRLSPSRVARRDYPTIVRGCAFRISWGRRGGKKTQRERERRRIDYRVDDGGRGRKTWIGRRYRWLEMPFVFRFPEFWWWNRGVARGDGWWRREQCRLPLLVI